MRGELIVLNHTGDMKLIWDGEKRAEVSAAKDMFDSMKTKGYLAYTVDKKGNKGEVLREFDAELEKIIMTPPMQGG